jgi:hypothetical protein
VAAEASADELFGCAATDSLPPAAMPWPTKLWLAVEGPWLEFACTDAGSWSGLKGGCWPQAETVVRIRPKIPRSMAVAWARPSVPWYDASESPVATAKVSPPVWGARRIVVPRAAPLPSMKLAPVRAPAC